MSGGNPYHDEKGRFTDGPSGGGGGMSGVEHPHVKGYAKGLSKENRAKYASEISAGLSLAQQEEASIRGAMSRMKEGRGKILRHGTNVPYGDDVPMREILRDRSDEAYKEGVRWGAQGNDSNKHVFMAKAHALSKLADEAHARADKIFSNPKSSGIKGGEAVGSDTGGLMRQYKDSISPKLRGRLSKEAGQRLRTQSKKNRGTSGY